MLMSVGIIAYMHIYTASWIGAEEVRITVSYTLRWWLLLREYLHP